MKAVVVDPEGKRIGEQELPAEVFGLKPNPVLLWEVVQMYLARRRQGTAKAKTRGEVRGSRRKIWPQKHTGRARHGDRYAPIFVGGGKAHPPRPRDWGYSMPKKAVRKALAMALSDRAKEGRVFIVKPGLDVNPPKTKLVYSFLKNAGLLRDDGDGANVLFVSRPENKSLYLSGRNIPRVEIWDARSVNAYHVLWSWNVVIEEPALEVLKERLAK